MAALRFLYYFGGAIAVLVLLLIFTGYASYLLTHLPRAPPTPTPTPVPTEKTAVNQSVVYVNRTIYVYINRTVPVYVNRTVYVYVPTYIYENPLPEYYGYCSGRLVVLPNGTGWLVVFMLVNPRQYAQYWLEGLGTLYTNATTHYTQFVVLLEPVDLIFLTANYTMLSLPGGFSCYTMNYTINGYWPAVCGDVGGTGPSTLTGVNTSSLIEDLGVNTTQTALMYVEGIAVPSNVAPVGVFIPCQLTITYAPNPTAALWLPVTPNATLLNYLREGEVEVFGHYDPYDWTMGYSVWRTPS